MRNLLLGLCLSCCLGSFSVACVDGGDGERPVDEAVCESSCSRYDELCGKVAFDCASQCREVNTNLARMRSAASDVLASCISQDSCEGIETGSPDCFEEAASSLGSTAAQKRFCAEYVTRAFECRGYVTVDECASWFSLWGDEAMDSLYGCLDEDCDDTSDCIGSMLKAG